MYATSSLVAMATTLKSSSKRYMSGIVLRTREKGQRHGHTQSSLLLLLFLSFPRPPGEVVLEEREGTVYEVAKVVEQFGVVLEDKVSPAEGRVLCERERERVSSAYVCVCVCVCVCMPVQTCVSGRT